MRDALPALVIGTGSIGRRHVASLRTIVPETPLIFLRESGAADDYSAAQGATVVRDLPAALAMDPRLAILANPSDLHARYLRPLLAAGIPTFVEKPVVIDADDLAPIEALATPPVTQTGLVLRFLPSLIRLRDAIDAGALGRIIRASFEVGQHLPDWRPTQDYRTGYSASAARGGGVVFDLVHELDLACWLLGDMQLCGAWGGRRSSLEIDSEDVALLALRSPDGAPVAVQLDYCARPPIRRLTIVGDVATASWDLRARTIKIGDDESSDGFDTDDAYRVAMTEFVSGAMHGGVTSVPLSEGLRSTRLAIAANAQLRAAA